MFYCKEIKENLKQDPVSTTQKTGLTNNGMLHISMCKWGELFLSCWLFFSFLFFLLPCFLWIIVLHLRKQGSSLSTPLPFTISTAGNYYLPPFVILWIILASGSEWYHIFIPANTLKQRQILKIPGILLLPAIPVDQILNNGVCWRKKAMINGTRLFTFQPLCLSDLLWLKGEPIDIQIPRQIRNIALSKAQRTPNLRSSTTFKSKASARVTSIKCRQKQQLVSSWQSKAMIGLRSNKNWLPFLSKQAQKIMN